MEVHDEGMARGRDRGWSAALFWSCLTVVTMAAGAAAQPVVGPAQLSKAPVLRKVSAGGAGRPAVAFNGSEYLVAYGGGFYRVGAGGAVLNRPGEAFADNYLCPNPRVFAVGAGWHVWCLTGLRRYAIDAAGAVTMKDYSAFTAPRSGAAALAAIGERWLLAWHTGGDGSDVMGAILDASGGVVGAAPFAIGAGPGVQKEPSVAAVGSQFLVAYTDNRYTDVISDDVRTTFVSAGGVVATPDGVQTRVDGASHEYQPVLIAGQPSPLLVYFQRTGPEGNAVWVRAVHLSASNLAIESTPSTLGASPIYGVPAYGYHDGSRHVVFFESSKRIFAYAVAADGSHAVFAAIAAASSNDALGAVASDGAGGALFVYGRDEIGATGNFFYLVGRRLDAAGSTGDEIMLTASALAQQAQAVAGNGQGYLALLREWDDDFDRFDPRYVSSLVALDFAGRPTSAPRELVRGGMQDDAQDCDVAALPNGRYLIVCRDEDTRLRTYVAERTGEFVATGVRLMQASLRPRLSVAGQSVLCLAGTGTQLYFQRFGFDGLPLGAAVAVSTAVGSRGWGAVASAQDQHLIVWQDNRDAATQGWDVYGSVVGADGTVLSRSALTIAVGAGEQTLPAVTGVGSGWLVAWADSAGANPIGLRTVAADGTLGTAGGMSSGAEPAGQIALVRGADTTLLAWVHDGIANSALTIEGALLTDQGTVSGVPFTIFSRALGPWYPHLGEIASTGGQFIVTYDVWDRPASNNLAYARALHFGTPVGEPCSASAQCNGACVDGVCCAQSCGDGPGDCRACSVAAGSVLDGACTVLPATSECRAAARACDAAERCDGSGSACPPDLAMPDGSACGDGDACNGDERCHAGVCAADGALVCDDFDRCTADACDALAGCQHTAVSGCPADAGAGSATDAGGDPQAPPDAASGASGGAPGPAAGSSAAGGGGSSGQGAGVPDAGAVGASAVPGSSSHARDGGSGTNGAFERDGGSQPEDGSGAGESNGGCGCQVLGATSSARSQAPRSIAWLLALVLVGRARSALGRVRACRSRIRPPG